VVADSYLVRTPAVQGPCIILLPVTTVGRWSNSEESQELRKFERGVNIPYMFGDKYVQEFVQECV